MSSNQVLISGVMGSTDANTTIVDLGQQENLFETMTVLEMRTKIKEQIVSKFGTGVIDDPNDLRLQLAGKEVQNKNSNGDEYKLKDFGIKKNSTLQVSRATGGPLVKAYDPEEHFGVQFTLKPDAITGEGEDDDDDDDDDGDDDDDQSENRKKGNLRALLTCGHAAAPESLTQWCRSLIDQGIIEFHCPAVVDKTTNKLCKKIWEYTEVRKIALLTEEEMKYFERMLSQYAARKFCEFKECPGCKRYLERKDTSNLRVSCPFCTAAKKNTYDFCWTCEREWQGSKWEMVSTCGRSDCVHPEYPAIRDAPMVNLPAVNLGGKKVPSRRACPTCGNVVEHSLQGCKFMNCQVCHVHFCFVCLNTEVVCLSKQGGTWFRGCVDGIAPRQTSIPVWSRS